MRHTDWARKIKKNYQKKSKKGKSIIFLGGSTWKTGEYANNENRILRYAVKTSLEQQ